MPSFADIAKKKAADVERPPLPPVGNYIMQCIAEPSVTERSSDKGEFEIVDFIMQGVQHLDDVDVDELKKFGGAKGVRGKISFIFNTSPEEEANFQQTEYRLRNFLVDHLQAGPASETLGALIGMAKGKRCQAEVGHRPDAKQPDVFYTDIKQTAPVA